MILVTGATGLVGSHLVYNLCRAGKQVRAIKRSNSNVANVRKVFSYYTNTPDELLKNIEWIDADLMDVYSLMDAMEGITEVYHCAAMVSFEQKYEKEMMRFNIEGTANMVNAAIAKRINKFLHVSSIATIGKAKNEELCTEELFWKSSPDNSNYSISKYGAEREVWRASKEGLNVVIVNPSIIIGGGNWQQTSSNMFSKASKGILFYTHGANGFIDVRDVAALMVKLMESEITNQRYILSTQSIAFRTYFDWMHIAFNKPKSKIKAGKLLSTCGWMVENIRHFTTGATPLITKETARSAHHRSFYSNKKVTTLFPDYTFIPVEEAVKYWCNLFKKDKA